MVSTDEAPARSTSLLKREAVPDAIDLISAIGHEVGNHLGGIRLQAHFLDEDLDARALARASVEIDALAGRAAPLLALLRPVLASGMPVDAVGESTSAKAGGRATRSPIQWSALLAQLRQQLEDEGTRGVPVVIEEWGAGSEQPMPSSSVAVEGFHHLVYALVGATVERLDPKHPLRIAIAGRDAATVLSFSDAGPQEDLSGRGGLRGRSLVLAIARRLLSRVGGSVEARAVGDQTRIDFIVPH